MNWQFWRRPPPPPPAPPAVPTPSEVHDSHAEWLADYHARHDVGVARHVTLVEMQAWPEPTYTAYCIGCDAERAFPLAWHGTDAPADFREALACPECGLNARQRTAFGLLRDRLPSPDSDVYATELISTAFLWLRRRYKRTRGSEYGLSRTDIAKHALWLARNAVGQGIDLQDVTALTYADASLDAIVSFDVLEHVPRYRDALREFARTLRPGGWLIATAPFIALRPETTVRARVDEAGNIEHLLPPEIHGDPLSDGVLCYYHFGWDILDDLRRVGFARADWHYSWAPEQALFGMWTLVAQKGA
jgi:SAM-dependent methyltransferase